MLPGKRCASPAGTKVERCCLVPKISRSAADRRTYNRPARKAFPRRPRYGFVEVAQAVRQAAEALGSAQASTLTTPEATSTAGSSQPAPRSSNLRFKKEFTDCERHRFLTEAFEYVARYFENSPNELHGRNTDVETDFRRIDANRFEAIAFVGGREQRRCGIWFGGLSRTDGRTESPSHTTAWAVATATMSPCPSGTTATLFISSRWAWRISGRGKSRNSPTRRLPNTFGAFSS